MVVCFCFFVPVLRTLQTVGPSHARTYTVAVYFKGERIGCGKGPRWEKSLHSQLIIPVSSCKHLFLLFMLPSSFVSFYLSFSPSLFPPSMFSTSLPPSQWVLSSFLFPAVIPNLSFHFLSLPLSIFSSFPFFLYPSLVSFLPILTTLLFCSASFSFILLFYLHFFHVFFHLCF